MYSLLRKEPGDSNYTTYQTKENIASNENIGLAVSYNRKFNKWWTLNVFGNVFNNHYKGVIDNEQIDVSLTSFEANLSSQLLLTKAGQQKSAGFIIQKILQAAIYLHNRWACSRWVEARKF